MCVKLWHMHINKQDIANSLFTDILKNEVVDALNSRYGVERVEYKLLNYGMGIEIYGGTNSQFILSTISKVTQIPMEAFTILSENKKEKVIFYAYFPENDKTLRKKQKLNI